MATYTRTYTYTGLNNWTANARSVALSRFTVSGDTTHTVGEILSIRYTHYHASGSSHNYTLRGRLVLSDGTNIDSDIDSARISEGEVEKYSNTWSQLPTAEQFAKLTTVQTIINGGSAASDGRLTWNASSKYKLTLVITFTDVPPTTYAPTIEKFAVRRVTSGGAESDEGVLIATDLKLAISSDAPLNSAKLMLYKGKSEDIADATSVVDLTSKIAVLVAGVNNDTTIITGEYSIGDNWFFTLVFSIGSETAQKQAAVYRAFVPQTTSAYGCGFGGVSTATAQDPKNEFFTPTEFKNEIRLLESNEWEDLALVAGSTPASLGGGKLRCRKVAGKCIIDGSVLAKPLGNNTVLVIADLPDGFTPQNTVFSLNACQGLRIARIVVGGTDSADITGKLGISWVCDIKDASYYTADAIWIQCSIEYWVE